MRKINAIPGSIKWNGTLWEPKLIIHFRRAENSNEWYEIHIKLTPDFVTSISLELKKYVAAWWQKQQNKLTEIQEHLKF